MKVLPRRVEQDNNIYVVCGQCGNRLATIIKAGRIVDEAVPWECDECHCEVDRGSGDTEGTGTEIVSEG